MKILPYVYKCTHKTTNQFYFGFRCRNKLPSDQDIVLYRTSSKYVNLYFDDFSVEILAEFFDKISAYDFEQYLIYEEWNNPLILNKSCFYGGARFSTVGVNHSTETKLKISTSKRGRHHTTETKQKIRQARLNNGEKYIHRKRIYSVSTETKQKISLARKGKNHQTPEHKERLRQINSGKRWYTNGDINIKAIEQPDNFVLGRTIKRDGSIPS